MIKRQRLTGSAHTGLGEWLAQRITALYLAGFALFVVIYFLVYPKTDFVTWRAWFSQGPVRLAWALFFLSVLIHAWVGLRSIYMDYLYPLWLRFSMTVLTVFGLSALGLWAARLLLEV